MNHSHTIIEFFEENFNEKKCHELCRRHGFIKRSTSKLEGYEFIKTMIMPSEGLSVDSLKGLCKRLQKFNPEADLSAQALCKRINSISSGSLMKGIFSEILVDLHRRLKKSRPRLVQSLNFFNRVLLQDSTLITLNEIFEKIYKGCKRGNNCIKSQFKIDVIHDISNGVLIDASIFNGNDPDQGLSGRIINFIEPGDLIIRDLGYFSCAVLRKIIACSAYFISRLRSCVNFYLNKDDVDQLDLSKYLKKKRNLKNVIEIEGYLGKEKVPCRLVIYRQPKEVTEKRQREANKNSRKKGEKMSESKKLMLEYTMLITNVPENIISAEMLGTMYRIRWEIELVFKRWKSQLKIDYLKGIKKERIDCLIWGRLCSVLILELIIGCFKKFIDASVDVELSEVKLIQYIMRESAFCLALAKNKLEEFFDEMEKDISRMLLKDRRKRRTMRERILQKEAYYQMKSTESQKKEKSSEASLDGSKPLKYGCKLGIQRKTCHETQLIKDQRVA
jgi:hypothetical protein